MYDELTGNLRAQATHFSVHDETSLLLLKAADAIEYMNGHAKVLEKVADYWCERVPKWIPVAERLPESVCKSYLCLTDTGYHCEVRWTNNVYGLRKSDNKWGWSIADVPQYCNVTHWMPLPEPPKEET